jgi:hypothetical protein
VPGAGTPDAPEEPEEPDEPEESDEPDEPDEPELLSEHVVPSMQTSLQQT